MRRQFRVTYTNGVVEVIEADVHNHDLNAFGGVHIFRTVAPDDGWLPERRLDGADVVTVFEMPRRDG